MASWNTDKCYCTTCNKMISSTKKHEQHNTLTKDEAVMHLQGKIVRISKKLSKILNNLKSLQDPVCLTCCGNEFRHYKSHKELAQLYLDIDKMILPSVIHKDAEKETIRIASWNLTDFSSKFITQLPNKVELVSATIKCHEFDIVALQEVGETKDVHDTDSAAYKLCMDLQRIDPTAKWDISYTEKPIGAIRKGTPVYGVFLYKSVNIKCTTHATPLNNEQMPRRNTRRKFFGRDPVLANFKFKTWEFSLINFHLTPRYDTEGTERNDTQLMNIHKLVKDEGDYIILLGDFNTYVSKENTKLHEHVYEYENIFTKTEYTNTSTKNQSCLDAIIVDCDVISQCMQHGVADIVLKGDIKEEDISTHKPIWADIDIQHFDSNTDF